MSQDVPVTPEEQAILAKWENDMRILSNLNENDLHAIRKAWADRTNPMASQKSQDRLLHEEAVAENKLEARFQADQKKLTTDRVNGIIDKELTALIPALQEKGYGKLLGKEDGILTLEVLKKSLGDLLVVDRNQDGIFSLEEAVKSLPRLPQATTPTKGEGRS